MLTNLSTNSREVIKQDIESRYRIHPVLGLRQAELIRYAKMQSLEEAKCDQQKLTCDADELAQRIAQLEHIDSNPILRWAYNAIAFIVRTFRDCPSLDTASKRLTLKLSQIKVRYEFLEPLVRDAAMELSVAVELQKAITEGHPDLASLGYEGIQKLGAEILAAERSFNYASAIWSFNSGLPEGVGKALFELPPEERKTLIARINNHLNEDSIKTLNPCSSAAVNS